MTTLTDNDFADESTTGLTDADFVTPEARINNTLSDADFAPSPATEPPASAGRLSPHTDPLQGVLIPESTHPGDLAFKKVLQDKAMEKAQKESALAAGGREVAMGVAPTVAGLAGGAAGAKAGTAIGAGIGTAIAPGPGTLIGGGIGGVAGGLIGGIGSAYLAAKGQEKAIEAIDPEFAAQLQAEREAAAQVHPVATFAGSLAPQLIGMKPSIKNVGLAYKGAKTLLAGDVATLATPAGRVMVEQLANVGIGAGVEGSQEVYEQYKAGDLNAGRLLARITIASLISEPNRFGVRLGLKPSVYGGEPEIDIQPDSRVPVAGEAVENVPAQAGGGESIPVVEAPLKDRIAKVEHDMRVAEIERVMNQPPEVLAKAQADQIVAQREKNSAEWLAQAKEQAEPAQPAAEPPPPAVEPPAPLSPPKPVPPQEQARPDIGNRDRGDGGEPIIPKTDLFPEAKSEPPKLRRLRTQMDAAQKKVDELSNDDRIMSDDPKLALAEARVERLRRLVTKEEEKIAGVVKPEIMADASLAKREPVQVQKAQVEPEWRDGGTLSQNDDGMWVMDDDSINPQSTAKDAAQSIVEVEPTSHVAIRRIKGTNKYKIQVAEWDADEPSASNPRILDFRDVDKPAAKVEPPVVKPKPIEYSIGDEVRDEFGKGGNITKLNPDGSLEVEFDGGEFSGMRMDMRRDDVVIHSQSKKPAPKSAETEKYDSEKVAVEFSNNKKELEKRLRWHLEWANIKNRAAWKLDFENKRLVSPDGKQAVQWKTRNYPDKPISYDNQQTSQGGASIVDIGTKPPPADTALQTTAGRATVSGTTIQDHRTNTKSMMEPLGGSWTEGKVDGQIGSWLDGKGTTIEFRHAGIEGPTTGPRAGQQAMGMTQRTGRGKFTVTIDPRNGDITTPPHELAEIVGMTARKGLSEGYNRIVSKALKTVDDTIDLNTSEGAHRFAVAMESKAGRDKVADALLKAAPGAQQGFRKWINNVIRMVNRLFGANVAEFKDADFVKLANGMRDFTALKQLVEAGRRAEGQYARGEARQVARVTPEQDKAYTSAVERGDTETAQRMVDEAAKKAGLIGPYYHGGPSGITEFKRGSGRSGLHSDGFWFTNSEGERGSTDMYDASTYAANSPNGKVYRAYIRMERPARVFDTAIAKGNITAESLKSQGYDSADMAESGFKVVLDPSQIKSADPITRDDQGRVIPLSDRFNDASPDIRYQTRQPTGNPAADSGFAKADRMEQEANKLLTEKKQPLRRRIRDFVGRNIATINAPVNTRRNDLGDLGLQSLAEKSYITQQAQQGASSHALDRFTKVTDEWKRIGIKEADVPELGKYMAAQRAKELYDQFDSGARTEPVKSPFSKDEAAAMVSVIESGANGQKMKDAAAAARKAFSDSLDALLESGTINRTSYNNIKQSSQYYFPRAFLDHIDPPTGIMEKTKFGEVQVRKSGVRHIMEGSEGDMLTDPLMLIAQNISHAETLAAKNKSLVALRDLTDAATPAQKAQSDWDMTEIPFDQPAKRGYEKIEFWKDGEKKALEVRTDLASALKIVDSGVTSDIAKLARTLSGTSLVKFMATSGNPEFAIGNTFRDLGLHYLASSEYSAILPRAMAQQVAQAAKITMSRELKRKLREGFSKYGGGSERLSTSTFLPDPLHAEKYESGKKLLHKVIGAMGYVGNKSEEMSRLMLVNQALKNMGTDATRATPDQWAKAVSIGKEIINFSDHGKLIKALDTVIPFLNPSFQGGRSVARAFKTRPVETTMKAAQIMATGALMAYYNRKNDDDAWESVSESEKSTKFIIGLNAARKDKDGSTRYGYIGIPMDQGWRPFLILGQMIADKLDGREVSTALLKKSIAANYVPIDFANLPPVASAMLTYSQNHDFWTGDKVWRGRDVEPTAERKLSTPAIANIAGDVTGLSPERLKAATKKLIPQNPMSTVAGYAAEFMSSDPAKDMKEDNMVSLSQMPGLRRIFRVTSPRDLQRDDILTAKRLRVESRNKPAAQVLNEIQKAQVKLNTYRQKNDVLFDKMAAKVKSGEMTKVQLLREVQRVKNEGGRPDVREIKRLRQRLHERYPQLRIPAPRSSDE